MMRTNAVVLPAQGPPVNTIRLMLFIVVVVIVACKISEIQAKRKTKHDLFSTNCHYHNAIIQKCVTQICIIEDLFVWSIC